MSASQTSRSEPAAPIGSGADTARIRARADPVVPAGRHLRRQLRRLGGVRRHPALSARLPAGAGPRLGLAHRGRGRGLLRGQLRLLGAVRPAERLDRAQAGDRRRRGLLRAWPNCSSSPPPIRPGSSSSASWRAWGRRPSRPAAQALVADLSAEKDRSRAYGWMTTAQFGGLVAGPGAGLAALQPGRRRRAPGPSTPSSCSAALSRS